MIYLDYAAATPMDEQVLDAMMPYFSDNFFNPSATYLPAVKVRKELDIARAGIAHWLGARPSEVIFTAGGTEANNLAIHGVMSQFPGANILVSSIDHDSVLVPANQYESRQVQVLPDGRIDLHDLESKIDDKTVLISIGYANNEIGTVQPIKDIAKIIEAVVSKRGPEGLPLYFHTDAAQATNYLDLHVARLGVDLMSLNGGKIYGPKQSGVLYVKAGLTLRPLIAGGGQERNIRSGSENVAADIGLAKAVDIVQADRHNEVNRLKQLQDKFINFVETNFTDAVINGSKKFRLPNNIHITFPGIDNERLLLQLDEAGVLAAAGSACSASDEEPSHVLRAIGLDEPAARSSIRFTMGRSTTEDDINKTMDILRSLLA